MKTFAFPILFMILTAVNLSAQMPPIEPGVSLNLAQWRSKNYSDVRYKLNITLEKGAPLMKGTIEIRVKLTDEGAKNPLILDWRTTSFENDKDKPYAKVFAVNEKSDIVPIFEKEHILIPQKSLKKGENIIKIEFASPIKTSGSAITRYVDKEDGAEYVYSLFVPSDASTAFPVFDQPDLKARFQLNIIAPDKWNVISNTNKQEIFTFKEAGTASGNITNFVSSGNKEVKFEETKPISTYVFAFAAGEFAEVEDKNNSAALTSKIYVRKSQAEKIKQHAAEVFRLNRESVKYFEEYFDYKFPFPKYDLVLIPEFPFGGMEHAGATFLRESSVIFPNEPTKNDFVSRANLIFHEAAHQWFGDLVTMRWFDDLWLKEGFATFVGYKALEKLMPEYNAWKIFYERNKQSAYQTDITRGTTPIYQEIPNLSAAKSAYGAIVYSKAPSFLRQAEFYLGEKEFQAAVRSFLKKYQFSNAAWQELVKEFETASKQDLEDWANSWVTGRGVSIFRSVIFNSETGTKPDNRNFRLLQSNLVSQQSLLRKKTKILVIQADNTIQKIEFTNPKFMTGDFLLIKESDKFIFPNYEDYGYGIFLLDEKSRAYVLENVQSEKDDFLRTMMWGALWDSVRFYELAPEVFVDLAIKNIKNEADESTIQTLLSRIGTAMNYYLSDKKRDEITPRLETLLIERMQNAETLGQRITFYRAFLNTASSENARNVLKEILHSKFKIQNFNLKTKDKFDILTRLIVLGDKDALNLLAELEKNETSDDARRYAYAARAGIGTAENKAKYWNDFTANKELSESWIEAAFVPFNSPRHSDLTLPYLEKALAELPNLKRNRKIFFVNGWLGAFIGGQKSEEALKIVNKFLDDNPNLDKDLRLKILENADLIERAVKIRASFGKNSL